MESGDAGNQDGPRSKPAGVIVIAILLLLFGGMGVCCTPFGALGYLDNSNPVIAAIKESPVAFGMNIANMGFNFIMGAISVALGIGLLKLKEWGRKGTIITSVINILYTFVYAIVAFFVMGPIVSEAMLAQMQSQSQGKPLPPGLQEFMQKMGSAAGSFGGFCGAAIALLVGGIFIFYLTRPTVKAAFK